MKVDLEELKRLHTEAWDTFDGGSKFINALIHAFPAIVAALEKETK